MSIPRVRIAGGILGMILLAAAAGPASAQSLFGLEDGMAAPPIMLHEFTSGCQPINVCPLPPLPPPIPFPQGGVAYGKCSSSVYSTDGIALLVQTDTQCNIRNVCPLMPVAAPWGGIDVDEARGMLYFVDLAGGIGSAPLGPGGCPGPPMMFCMAPPPLAPPLTGIAYDPVTATAWVVDANGTVANLALVAGGCQVLRAFRAVCPGGPAARPISGIAFDGCNRLIHLADPAGSIITMNTAGAPVNCCRVPSVPPPGTFVGLTFRPVPATPLGVGCSDRLCPPCVPVATTRGDATPANSCFALDVNSAPVGPGFLLLNVVPGPVPLPGFCGPLQVGIAPPPIVLPIPLAPNPALPPPCNGTASLPLPIPANNAFCGATVFVQWLIVCPAPVPVFSMSNGLAVTFS